jgi:hypothetical protein
MADRTFSTFDIPAQGDTTDLGATLALLVVTRGAYALPNTLKQQGLTMEEHRSGGNVTVTADSSDRTITVDDTL